MDEAQLIQYAREGDLTAFNRLVLAYQDIAYNVAYRIMGDHAAAEDATQDAFIKAYKKLHTFSGSTFKVWMLRVVTNTCYDELRRRKRRPTTPLIPGNDDDDDIDQPGWLVDPSESPEDHACLTCSTAAWALSRFVFRRNKTSFASSNGNGSTSV